MTTLCVLEQKEFQKIPPLMIAWRWRWWTVDDEDRRNYLRVLLSGKEICNIENYLYHLFGEKSPEKAWFHNWYARNVCQAAVKETSVQIFMRPFEFLSIKVSHQFLPFTFKCIPLFALIYELSPLSKLELNYETKYECKYHEPDFWKIRRIFVLECAKDNEIKQSIFVGF